MSTVRRIPSQERSRLRLERILGAAAEIFAEAGYEAATMEMIASRAGTSIGSLYQFFPNKAAVFQAVARSCLERSRALFDALMAEDTEDASWKELLERLIEAFFAFHRSEPGFRAVWHNLMLAPTFVVEGEQLNRLFADRVKGVLARKVPHLRPRKRARVATVLVEVLSGMLLFASRNDALADGLRAETKVLLVRYLRPYVLRPRAKVASAPRGRVVRRGDV